ncbi:MAG: hypothetical protein DWI28_01990 [Planctomycetota bacterium]|nr:MAG: hypothetical protein DWI28_01990 [Planctomycetota bacterium]
MEAKGLQARLTKVNTPNTRYACRHGPALLVADLNGPQLRKNFPSSSILLCKESQFNRFFAGEPGFSTNLSTPEPVGSFETIFFPIKRTPNGPFQGQPVLDP